MARTRSSTKSVAPRPHQEAQLEPAKATRGPKRKREAVDDIVEVFSKRAKYSPKPKAEQRECDICAEGFAVTPKRFPNVSTCDHAQTVCSGCYITQIRTNLESNAAAGWTACTCPLCNVRIGHIGSQEARSLVTGHGVRALDKLIRDVSPVSKLKDRLLTKNRLKQDQRTISYGALLRTAVMDRLIR